VKAARQSSDSGVGTNAIERRSLSSFAMKTICGIAKTKGAMDGIQFNKAEL
jgi:hypothetical protein